MPSHTPGPWTVEADMRADQNFYGWSDQQILSGWNIMSAAGEIVGCEGILADGSANASLIGAAPDMFSALQVVRMSAGWSIMSDETRALVIAALKAATPSPSEAS